MDNLSIDTRKGQDRVTVPDIAYADSADNLVNFTIDLGGSVVNLNGATKEVLMIDELIDSYDFSTTSKVYQLTQPIHAGRETFSLTSNDVTESFDSQVSDDFTPTSSAVQDTFGMHLTESFEVDPVQLGDNKNVAALLLAETPLTVESVEFGGVMLASSQYTVSALSRTVTLNLDADITDMTTATVTYQRASTFKLSAVPINATAVNVTLDEVIVNPADYTVDLNARTIKLKTPITTDSTVGVSYDRISEVILSHKADSVISVQELGTPGYLDPMDYVFSPSSGKVTLKVPVSGSK